MKLMLFKNFFLHLMAKILEKLFKKVVKKNNLKNINWEKFVKEKNVKADR